MGIRSLKNGNTNSLAGSNSSVAKPSEAENLVATSNTSLGQIDVTWNQTKGSTPTSWVATTTPSISSPIIYYSGNTSQIIGGTAGTNYTVSVSGVNANGTGPSVTSNSVVAPTPGKPAVVNYLVVAGGGGGGQGQPNSVGASGGGAGGYRTGTQFAVTTGTSYTVTVGAGGVGPTTSDGANGGKGNPSTFASINSTGGGGGNGWGNINYAVLDGGSGGGRSAGNSGDRVGAGNLGGYSPSEGNNGGPGPSTGTGGAGGGASAVGTNDTTGGGAGSAWFINGVTYSTGGGGGGGGFGGRSAGSQTGTAAGQPGAANTGNGAGGNYHGSKYTTNIGGSGVVIVAYPDIFQNLASVSGGLTYTLTTSGGYKLYRFTAGTGTVTV